MGFYGNINNSSRANFTFDKIYPNRARMDANRLTDGIFTGRYVLVEYGSPESASTSEVSADTYKTAFCVNDNMYPRATFDENGVTWSVDESTILNPSNVSGVYKIAISHLKQNISTIDEYYQSLGVGVAYPISQLSTYCKYEISNFSLTESGSRDMTYATVVPEDTDEISDVKFYIINDCLYYDANSEEEYTGINQNTIIKIEAGCHYTTNGQTLFFKAANMWIPIANVVTDDTTKEYYTNYNIDVAAYGTDRGYDSTVWVKSFVDQQVQYIMIAELNSVVPTFEVTPDAPISGCYAPHFDSNSTNVYYNLHMRPSWNFRVRAADPDLQGPVFDKNGNIKDGVTTILTTNTVEVPSDENIQWVNQSKYYNVDTQSWSEEATEGVPAAIYYNKRGLDSKKISYSEDQKDKYTEWDGENHITIAPSGKSGQSFNDHNTPGRYKAEVDTQELSIMLPSIGDTVAHMWDLMYGGRETDDTIKNSDYRNQDIAWEDGSGQIKRKGLRLVNDDNAYDTAEINTVAGTINSVHDLMGMIITTVDDNDDAGIIADADENHIYFSNKTSEYYRKGDIYSYDMLSSDSYVENTIQVTKVGDFQSDLYYYKDANGNKINSYIDGKTEYYVKGLDANKQYVPVELSLFEQSTDETKRLYSKNNNNYYYITTPSESQNIYTITLNDPIILLNFNNKTMWTGDITNRFYLDTGYNSSNKYFYLTAEQISLEELAKPIWTNTSDLSSNTALQDKAVGDIVYAYVTKTENKDENGNITDVTYTIDAENDSPSKDPNDDRNNNTYYYATLTVVLDTNNVAPSGSSGTELVTSKRYQVTGVNTTGTLGSAFSSVSKTDFAKNRFIRDDDENPTEYVSCSYDDFVNTSNYIDGTIPLYTIVTGSNLSIYESSTYYYQSGNDYVLDTNSTMQSVNGYYYKSITGTLYLDKTFYTANNYYYIEDGNYVIDTSETGVINDDGNLVQHYDKNIYFYRPESPTEIYRKWTGSLDYIPIDMNLYAQAVQKTFIPLEGFARDMNTLHGLILRMNQVLANEELNTRDELTMQGAINNLNDIIARFTDLEPSNIVVVDSYGRIHGATFTTAQPFISSNDKTTYASEEDRFIQVDVDSNHNQPVITISHKFTAVDDTTSSSDKNGNGDTIQLYTPITDNMGHVVGKNTETVTLPYGFKTMAIGTQSTATTNLTANTTSVVADNTQDTITFKSGNKWIKFSGDATNDAITVAHEVPGINSTSVSNITDNKFGGTITIPDIEYDVAGHITKYGTHTVNIPIRLGTYTAPTAITTSAGTTINASDISTTTNLGVAIATLDKRIMTEEKSRTDAIDGLDVTGTTSFGAGKTISTWSESNGKVNITSQDISITKSQISDLSSLSITASQISDLDKTKILNLLGYKEQQITIDGTSYTLLVKNS